MRLQGVFLRRKVEGPAPAGASEHRPVWQLQQLHGARGQQRGAAARCCSVQRRAALQSRETQQSGSVQKQPDHGRAPPHLQVWPHRLDRLAADQDVSREGGIVVGDGAALGTAQRGQRRQLQASLACSGAETARCGVGARARRSRAQSTLIRTCFGPRAPAAEAPASVAAMRASARPRGGRIWAWPGFAGRACGWERVSNGSQSAWML